MNPANQSKLLKIVYFLCELDKNFFSYGAEDGITRLFVTLGLEDTLNNLIIRHMHNEYLLPVSSEVVSQVNNILNEFFDESNSDLIDKSGSK